MHKDTITSRLHLPGLVVLGSTERCYKGRGRPSRPLLSERSMFVGYGTTGMSLHCTPLAVTCTSRLSYLLTVVNVHRPSVQRPGT